MLLDNKSYELTTMNTPLRLFLYIFIRFGIGVLLGICTNEESNVSAYQDDVMVQALSNKLYDEHLRLVFDYFRGHIIAINPGKSEFSSQNFT